MTARRTPYVFLNGRVLPAPRASINVFDRGWLYGDGLFETVRAYRGQPFGLREHLDRLRASAAFLGFGLPRVAWRAQIAALLRRNHLLSSDAAVRITVTRGTAVVPTLVPAARTHPTVCMSALPLAPILGRAQRRGVRATLLPFSRHGFLAEHKLLNYVPGVLGKAIAARHGAYEGLYVDADGCITEGTTSNVFVWRRGHLLTPVPAGILPGLTRRFVINAATAQGLAVREQPLRLHDVFAAEEAFLTSSLAEVLPLTAIDDRPIGTGKIGPCTRALQQAYRQIVDRDLALR